MTDLAHHIKSIAQVLGRAHRRKGFLILLLSILNVCLDLVSLVSVFPVALVVLGLAGDTKLSFLDKLQVDINLQDNRFTVLLLVALLLILFIFKTYFSKSTLKKVAYFTSGVVIVQANRVFQNLFTDYAKNATGELVTHITNIPNTFASSVLHNLFELLSKTVLILIAIVGLALLDTALFFFVFGLLIPTSTIYFYWKSKELDHIKQDLKKLQPLVVQYSLELLDGRIEIALGGQADHFKNRFKELNNTYNNSLAKLKAANKASPKSIELIAIVGICALLLYLYFSKMESGEMLSVLSIYLVAAYKVIPSLGGIHIAYTNLMTHRYSTEILLKYGKNHLADNHARDLHEHIPFEESIQFNHVSFRYEQEKTVLKNAHFEVHKDDKIAIVGRSGSGKSTLIKMVMGFTRPDKGTIFIDHSPLDTAAKIHAWRKQIAYVPPSIFLFEGTLAENICMSWRIDRPLVVEIEERLHKLGLSNILYELPNGLNTHISEYGKSLSSGQKQRIGLIRALMQDKSVMVLDEVTSHLDDQNKEAVLRAITKILTLDKTLIFATHDKAIVDICNVKVEIDENKLVRATAVVL